MTSSKQKNVITIEQADVGLSESDLDFNIGI